VIDWLIAFSVKHQTAIQIAYAAAATAAVTAHGQREQGRMAEAMYEREAKEAEVEASGRELQRREQINRRLAQNVVGIAGSGMSGEGTPASIALEDAKKIGVSESMETLSDRLKAAQLRREGRLARETGNLNASSTLLKAGIGVASGGGYGG